MTTSDSIIDGFPNGLFSRITAIVEIILFTVLAKIFVDFSGHFRWWLTIFGKLTDYLMTFYDVFRESSKYQIV